MAPLWPGNFAWHRSRHLTQVAAPSLPASLYHPIACSFCRVRWLCVLSTSGKLTDEHAVAGFTCPGQPAAICHQRVYTPIRGPDRLRRPSPQHPQHVWPCDRHVPDLRKQHLPGKLAGTGSRPWDHANQRHAGLRMTPRRVHWPVNSFQDYALLGLPHSFAPLGLSTVPKGRQSFL